MLHHPRKNDMVGIRLDQDGWRNLPRQALAELSAPAAFRRCEKHDGMVDLGPFDELLGCRPDLAIAIEQFAFRHIDRKRTSPCFRVRRGRPGRLDRSRCGRCRFRLWCRRGGMTAFRRHHVTQDEGGPERAGGRFLPGRRSRWCSTRHRGHGADCAGRCRSRNCRGPSSGARLGSSA